MPASWPCCAWPIDIFPALNLPVVYVAQPYGGMDPAQMEGLLTFYYENHFLYITGIHHVESQNIQGFAQMKLFFHPGTDMAQAMAETVGYVNRAAGLHAAGHGAAVRRALRHRQRAGRLPGAVAARRKSIGEIQDQALFRVRPMFASLPGVSAPPPFGGNQRTDRRQRRSRPAARLPPLARRRGRRPERRQHRSAPRATSASRTRCRSCRSTPWWSTRRSWATSPSGPGENVYLRDLGTIEDGTDIPTSFALVNGQRAVYMLVTKRADASTLAVVNEVKANLPKMQAALPDGHQRPLRVRSVALRHPGHVGRRQRRRCSARS